MYFSDRVLKNVVRLSIESNSSVERISSNLISAFFKNKESEIILKNSNLRNIFSFFVIFFENSSLILVWRFVNSSEK